MIRLAVTPGEPAGIGPELMYHLACKDYDAELVVIGSLELIKQRCELYPDGKKIKFVTKISTLQVKKVKSIFWMSL